MRIFYAAADSPNYWGLPGSRLWYDNLYRPLVELGHELVRFDYDFGPHNSHLDPVIPAHRQFMLQHRGRLGDALWGQLTTAHRAKPIDMLFCYFYSAYVDPEVIRRVSGLGITSVNWFCNASYQFHTVEEIAPAFDYCLVPEKFRLDDYRRVGARPIYCQEAANPTLYKPYAVPVEFDVTFIGQRYGTRPLYVQHLIDRGIDARVWGPGWSDPPVRGAWRSQLKHLLLGHKLPSGAAVPPERCGPPLSDEGLIKMYSRSKISLGFSTVADGSGIKQVRLRDFEAPMSGAFYMVEDSDEIKAFFEPNKEIVCFGDPDELLDKTRYYLTHDAERQRIRDAGLRRARAEHTWQQRFRMAFRAMGLE